MARMKPLHDFGFGNVHKRSTATESRGSFSGTNASVVIPVTTGTDPGCDEGHQYPVIGPTEVWNHLSASGMTGHLRVMGEGQQTTPQCFGKHDLILLPD